MDKVRTAIAYVFFFVAGTLMSFLFPLFANAAWTATVNFDAPVDPAWATTVVVSEISGDYSAAYGQRSEPGATSVEIGNIKPSTTYYFRGYRLLLDTWEQSEWSDEMEYTTEAFLEPIVHTLPPTPISGDSVLNITVTITP